MKEYKLYEYDPADIESKKREKVRYLLKRLRARKHNRISEVDFINEVDRIFRRDYYEDLIKFFARKRELNDYPKYRDLVKSWKKQHNQKKLYG